MKELKKKEGTKAIVRALKRASRERKEGVWRDLAKRLSKPSRSLARVNLEKIARLGAKNKGKVLVVPGKVLGKGEPGQGVEVSAFCFSENAREKINGKGKALGLNELLESKRKGSEIVIVM